MSNIERNNYMNWLEAIPQKFVFSQCNVVLEIPGSFAKISRIVFTYHMKIDADSWKCQDIHSSIFTSTFLSPR